MTTRPATLRVFERVEETTAGDLRIGDELLDRTRGLVVSILIDPGPPRELRVTSISPAGVDRWTVAPAEEVRVVRPLHAPDRVDRTLIEIDRVLLDLDRQRRDAEASLTMRASSSPAAAEDGPLTVTAPETEGVDATPSAHRQARPGLPHPAAAEGDGRLACRDHACRETFYGKGQRTNHERARHPELGS